MIRKVRDFIITSRDGLGNYIVLCEKSKSVVVVNVGWADCFRKNYEITNNFIAAWKHIADERYVVSIRLYSDLQKEAK